MKFSLTISDATKEEIETFLSGAKALNIPGTMLLDNPVSTMTATVNNHQDDEGPINTLAPPADSTGLPWDDRIHSKNKGQNADGTWRKKRGVTDMAITAVENELRARGSSGMYMQQPVQQQQPVMQMPQQYQQPVQQQQPVMQMPQQYQQPVQQTPQQAPIDFQGFMQHLTQQMAKRDAQGMPLIETNYLANLSQRLSVAIGRPITNITEVANDPNALAQAVFMITQDGRW